MESRKLKALKPEAELQKAVQAVSTELRRVRADVETAESGLDTAREAAEEAQRKLQRAKESLGRMKVRATPGGTLVPPWYDGARFSYWYASCRVVRAALWTSVLNGLKPSERHK